MRKFLYVALYLAGACFGPSRSAAAEPLPRLIDAPLKVGGGVWKPALDSPGDFGWNVGGRDVGLYVTATGFYWPWDGKAYGTPVYIGWAKATVTAYTASWCGPCQSMKRDVLDTAEAKAVCDVVYVDASNGFPPGVSSVPTVTMPGRQPLVGYRPLREFLAWVRGQ